MSGCGRHPGRRPIEVLVVAAERGSDRHRATPPARHAAQPARCCCARSARSRRAAGCCASYLLFEAPYTRELMALGRAGRCTPGAARSRRSSTRPGATSAPASRARAARRSRPRR
ncbi:MAG: hypothetical protein MZW92_03960 [Comamonadaceae bacterium]|nr:hypothetical protein [Comamonadaceae bacterium]